MNRCAFARLLLLSLVLVSTAGAVEVVVEQKTSAGWHAVDPHHVFASQDQIRFVFRSDVPGNLYVLNRPPSGDAEWIFPAPRTDPENRVTPGQTYRIPAEGSFVISGPPGFDTTVWILSPRPLPADAAAGLIGDSTKGRALSTEENLIPRCSDTLLVARGPCTDDRAGATPFHERLHAPDSQGLLARDLNFSSNGDRTRITPRDGATGNVIVYEFRIAHR